MAAIWYRYSFVWVTLGFFLVTLIGHWVFGWFAYAGEQQAHGQLPTVSDFTIQMLRDTLENWQSEFLQLIWQVMGLAFLLHVGLPNPRKAMTGSRRRSMPSCVRWPRMQRPGSSRSIVIISAGTRTNPS